MYLSFGITHILTFIILYGELVLRSYHLHAAWYIVVSLPILPFLPSAGYIIFRCGTLRILKIICVYMTANYRQQNLAK